MFHKTKIKKTTTRAPIKSLAPQNGYITILSTLIKNQNSLLQNIQKLEKENQLLKEKFTLLENTKTFIFQKFKQYDELTEDTARDVRINKKFLIQIKDLLVSIN